MFFEQVVAQNPAVVPSNYPTLYQVISLGSPIITHREIARDLRPLLLYDKEHVFCITYNSYT
jgi:hypothetical protein